MPATWSPEDVGKPMPYSLTDDLIRDAVSGFVSGDVSSMSRDELIAAWDVVAAKAERRIAEEFRSTIAKFCGSPDFTQDRPVGASKA